MWNNSKSKKVGAGARYKVQGTRTEEPIFKGDGSFRASSSEPVLRPHFLTIPRSPAKILYSIEVKKNEKVKIMELTKVSPKHQITIPKEAFKKLNLEVGDFLEVDVTEEGLLLIPKKLISKDQSWFWSKEWQEKEKEADEAIAKGELSGPFETAAGLVRHLRKQK